MKTVFKFAFKKAFLIILCSLCLILLFLGVLCPLVGLERAEFKPVGFSVDAAGICYLGRGENLYVFKDGAHVDTLILPKELSGYDSFAVLPKQILFRNDGILWQSALDLSNVQKCSNQTEAAAQLKTENKKDEASYKFVGKLFYIWVKETIPNKIVARTPFFDNLYRSTFILLGLLIFVHGCRVSILVYKINQNSKRWSHPNWDD